MDRDLAASAAPQHRRTPAENPSPALLAALLALGARKSPVDSSVQLGAAEHHDRDLLTDPRCVVVPADPPFLLTPDEQSVLVVWLTKIVIVGDSMKSARGEPYHSGDARMVQSQ